MFLISLPSQHIDASYRFDHEGPPAIGVEGVRSAVISCAHALIGVPIDALRTSAIPSSDETPTGGAGAAAIEVAANSLIVTVCTIMPVDLPELAVFVTEKVASDGALASPLFSSMLVIIPTRRLITCVWVDPPVQRKEVPDLAVADHPWSNNYSGGNRKLTAVVKEVFLFP